MHYSRWRTRGKPGPPERIHSPEKGLACSVEGCDRERTAKSLCSTHYARLRVHGDPGSAEIFRGKPKGAPCEVEGCERLADGDGLCRMHYERRRKGKGLGPPEPVRRPKGSGHVTRHGYVMITVEGRSVLEHRHVMEQILGRPLDKHETVHHKDGQRQRNTPDNLELWVKPQPAGQRVEDLIRFVVDHYPEWVEGAMQGRTHI
jgi:hypothetical protein